MKKIKGKIYVSHGRTTHPVGAPCADCEEAEREWEKVDKKNLIEDIDKWLNDKKTAQDFEEYRKDHC